MPVDSPERVILWLNHMKKRKIDQFSPPKPQRAAAGAESGRGGAGQGGEAGGAERLAASLRLQPVLSFISQGWRWDPEEAWELA